MPRAIGYDLNAKRISRDLADFDVRHDGERARGTLPMRVLIAMIKALKDGKVGEDALLTFLQGGNTESNLVVGKEPILLEPFLFKHFLPKEKQPSVAKSTYETAIDEAKRLVKTLGQVPVHEIRQHHAKSHKDARQALKKANVSTKQDLHLLSQAMDYAVECGLIKTNYLLPVKGLPSTDRTPIWLCLKDITKLMRCLPQRIKPLVYFLILTGARRNEALRVTVSDIDWEKRTIRIPNSKRRRKSASKGKRYRTLKIDDLGPRFEWLLKKIIKPDLASGYLFPGKLAGTHLHAVTVDDLFQQGVVKADLDYLIPPEVAESCGRENVILHDCRRTFANHACIVGWSFQTLRAYMGQVHAESIQAYLDEADGHEPSESIFGHPPLRVRREKKRALLAKSNAAHISGGLPTSLFLN